MKILHQLKSNRPFTSTLKHPTQYSFFYINNETTEVILNLSCHPQSTFYINNETAESILSRFISTVELTQYSTLHINN